MKLSPFVIIASFLLLLECTSANNLRNEKSRDLNSVPCGDGAVGNTFCANPKLCCSQYGWCGTIATDHCDGKYPMREDIPCGDNVFGDRICEDPSLCCSQYGYCGSSADHCDGANPLPGPVDPTNEPTRQPMNPPVIPAPSPPTSTPPDNHGGENSRLVAYLGGWKECPTAEQLDQYTHIMIAFAVSYQWAQPKVQCSPTCQIQVPSPLCNTNTKGLGLIQEWQAAGKKVLLSFGGALMGGSWASSPDDCWEYCFGRENQVVDNLVDIAEQMGVDGVDIDYEYYYDDNQNGSGFSRGQEAKKFLRDVTIGLRNKLPEGSEVTHAPMDGDMVPGKGYFEVLKEKEVADSLDFIMPQYYNGIVKPAIDYNGAVQHFRALKDEVFDGDASKIAIGFCIRDCNAGYPINGASAASIMTQLGQDFPCNGGAFFWMASDDSYASWSSPVSSAIQNNGDQCLVNEPPDIPTANPTAKATDSTCEDDPDFYKGKPKKDCAWVGKRTNKRCSQKIGRAHV